MNIIEIIIMGLMEDGGQHKQWALIEVLKLIVGEEQYEILKKNTNDKGYDWDEGSAI